jgi:hypothetical protein
MAGEAERYTALSYRETQLKVASWMQNLLEYRRLWYTNIENPVRVGIGSQKLTLPSFLPVFCCFIFAAQFKGLLGTKQPESESGFEQVAMCLRYIWLSDEPERYASRQQ